MLQVGRGIACARPVVVVCSGFSSAESTTRPIGQHVARCVITGAGGRGGALVPVAAFPPPAVPPHSKGRGPKTYVYTVYALSSPVSLDVESSEVSRDVLLAAMNGLVLASAQLNVVYTREIDEANSVILARALAMMYRPGLRAIDRSHATG